MALELHRFSTRIAQFLQNCTFYVELRAKKKKKKKKTLARPLSFCYYFFSNMWAERKKIEDGIMSYTLF
jgi:hypothetical protein